MVLVDTSVWVRALGRTEPAVQARLDWLLARDAVAAHPLVYGELLVGDAGGRSQLLTNYALYTQLAPVPHEEVVAFVWHHRLMGRGVGWIDCHILAAAVVHGVSLWSVDGRLKRAARPFGVTFDETVAG